MACALPYGRLHWSKRFVGFAPHKLTRSILQHPANRDSRKSGWPQCSNSDVDVSNSHFLIFPDSLTDAWTPLCTNFANNSNLTAISRVVIRRFCRMSSSTVEIVALLVTTCACQGSKS
ncbi:hypothetical protein AVEN_154934-1 [Araneus ventricosus]|uniref:Uncharacterized protein n=1 Tax=Araneus ventricosus TaxID=182803 RepID=A0A4Y2A787_ARAVE|nr:hypothetical protein AVEN_154934-1 [Araneus ventricosus]